jgi:hypothetical protein
MRSSPRGTIEHMPDQFVALAHRFIACAVEIWSSYVRSSTLSAFERTHMTWQHISFSYK